MLTFNRTNQTGEDVSLITNPTGLELHFSEGVNILIIVLISLLIFLIVSGNFLVMLAFIVDKRLRTQSNLFLLNLAVCDFLLGAVAIPLYVPYLLTGKWMLGRFLCKLWLIVDYTMCTASAFNVVLISYDRFLAVTMAVLYRSMQQRHSQTVVRITVVWILSFLLYSPAILFWETFTGSSNKPNNVCVAGFYYTWYFLLGASSIGFALPLISISFFNLSIYWNIKTRSSKKRHPSKPHTSEERRRDVRPHNMATNTVLSSSRSHENDSRRSIAPMDVYMIQLNKDKKIAKSLAIIVCVFAICWAPYTFLMSIRAACQGYCVDSYWYDITFWLLWINSAINPALYPLCHRSFRMAFRKVFSNLCLRRVQD
ncbi:histamine H4 receptor [Pelodytes ibericus]